MPKTKVKDDGLGGARRPPEATAGTAFPVAQPGNGRCRLRQATPNTCPSATRPHGPIPGLSQAILLKTGPALPACGFPVLDDGGGFGSAVAGRGAVAVALRATSQCRAWSRQ